MKWDIMTSVAVYRIAFRDGDKMERSVFKELLAWKNDENRKPLILKGARQVGKTWVMKEFGKREYESVAYINLDGNPRMEETFNKDFDVKRIIEELGIEAGSSIEPGKTLIILDELQEVPKALSSLKYFCEDAPEYHVVAAGSLLGVAIQSGISYPVGKVDIIKVYPMTFVEFLEANEESDLAKIAMNPLDEKNVTFKSKMTEYLKKYYFTGGMPEVVGNFIKNRDYAKVRKIQKQLLELYENDFSKHIDKGNELERTRMIWNSIPMQLSKENKKFFFGQIKKGARASEFEVSIQWLIDCGLIYKVFCVNKPGIPLKSYTVFSSYKLFMCDVGLLGALSELDAKSIIEGNSIFEEFKGALTEQFVFQQLNCISDDNLYYYSNEKSRNVIDYLIQHDGAVMPIELKAEENLQSKSLKAFVDKFDVKKAVRFSLSNYREQEWLTNIPLWNVEGF